MDSSQEPVWLHRCLRKWKCYILNLIRFTISLPKWDKQKPDSNTNILAWKNEWNMLITPHFFGTPEVKSSEVSLWEQGLEIKVMISWKASTFCKGRTLQIEHFKATKMMATYIIMPSRRRKRLVAICVCKYTNTCSATLHRKPRNKFQAKK